MPQKANVGNSKNSGMVRGHNRLLTMPLQPPEKFQISMFYTIPWIGQSNMVTSKLIFHKNVS